MLNQDIYCPVCGTKLKQGEINRLNSGIDIACHVCGTEIIGAENPEIVGETKNSQAPETDLGKKIKTGIQTFVKKIKEFAEELDGNKNKDSSYEYSDE